MAFSAIGTLPGDSDGPFPGAARATSTVETYARQLVAALYGSKDPSRFPGVMPANLTHATTREIRCRPYWVSRKSDGKRVMIVLSSTEDGTPLHLLVDRDMRVWNTPIACMPVAFQKGTVLDGEVVVKPPSSETPIVQVTLVAFEAAMVMGKPLTKFPMSFRIRLAEELLGMSGAAIRSGKASVIPIRSQEDRLMSGNLLLRLAGYKCETVMKLWVPASKAHILSVVEDSDEISVESDDEKEVALSSFPPAPRITRIEHEDETKDLHYLDNDVANDGFILAPEIEPMPTSLNCPRGSRVFKVKPGGDTIDLRMRCEEIVGRNGAPRCLLRLIYRIANDIEMDAGMGHGFEFNGKSLRFQLADTEMSVAFVNKVMQLPERSAVVEFKFYIEGNKVFCEPVRLRSSGKKPNMARTIVDAFVAVGDDLTSNEIEEMAEGAPVPIVDGE